jgi:alanyl-tRNA synthetase
MVRLYYTDSFLTSFDARVVESGVDQGRPFVVLDRTAFYPTTGGQPHDTGTLGDRKVLNVIDREADAAVLHVLDSPLEPGAGVRGQIDWPRRLDHMQQHTGQHLLSAAFVRLFEIPTVSFHLGADLSTIDLAGAVEPEAIARAEEEANQVVWDDRVVHVKFVSADEAALLPLRKEPARGGTLRIVEVEGFDLSACGGTHVVRTGTIGIVAVQSWERYKGGTRVSFACGGRVLRHFRTYREIVSGVLRQLSIQPAELSEAVSRLQADARDARQHSKALAEQLAVHEAEALVREAVAAGGYRIVCRAVEGRDAVALKLLAQSVAGRPGHAVALASGGLVVIARASDVALNAGEVVKALTGRFGGKGGGRPEMAQAGGLDTDAETICAAAHELLGGGSPPSSSASR